MIVLPRATTFHLPRVMKEGYSYRGYLADVKEQIVNMAMNGSGIRDTARVLKISPTTVIEELKKRPRPGASE